MRFVFAVIIVVLYIGASTHGFPSTVSNRPVVAAADSTSSTATPETGTSPIPAEAGGTTTAGSHGDDHEPSTESHRLVNHSSSEGGHAAGAHHEKQPFPIITVDFIRVATPFIICAWVFLTGIAKIGE